MLRTVLVTCLLATSAASCVSSETGSVLVDDWCTSHEPVVLSDEAIDTIVRDNPGLAARILADNQHGIENCGW